MDPGSGFFSFRHGPSLAFFTLGCQAQPHVDEVIGDHAQSNPALHAFLAPVVTPVQSVPPLQNADSAFASGAPALGSFERWFFLM